MLLDGDLSRPTRVLLVQDITFSFMRCVFDDFALLHSLILNDKLIIFHPLLKFTQVFRKDSDIHQNMKPLPRNKKAPPEVKHETMTLDIQNSAGLQNQSDGIASIEGENDIFTVISWYHLNPSQQHP